MIYVVIFIYIQTGKKTRACCGGATICAHLHAHLNGHFHAFTHTITLHYTITVCVHCTKTLLLPAQVDPVSFIKQNHVMNISKKGHKRYRLLVKRLLVPL